MKFQLYNRSSVTYNPFELDADLWGKNIYEKNASEHKVLEAPRERLADIGFIGLSVLSQNLILNVNDHGYVASVYDNETDIVSAFAKHEAKHTSVICSYNIEQMLSKLKSPKIVMLRANVSSLPPFIEYGERMEAIIEKLLTLLLPGDVIVDYSESSYESTIERAERLEPTGILFVDCGVVRDEDEVRRGPLLMPAGNPKAWPHIKPIFQAICGKIDEKPSCQWIGDSGFGHFIFENYIRLEKKELSLIEETYWLMRYCLNLSHKDISEAFAEWNVGDMKSSALQICSDILGSNEEIDSWKMIYASRTAQEGTGRWTAITHPQRSIDLYMRSLYYKCLTILDRPCNQTDRRNIDYMHNDKIKDFLEHLKNALRASIVYSYATLMMPLKRPPRGITSDFDHRDVLRMYKASSFFRSEILDRFEEALDNEGEMKNFALCNYVAGVMNHHIASIREVVINAYQFEIPIYNFSGVMTDYDVTYTTKTSLYMSRIKTRIYVDRDPTLEELMTYVD